MILRAGWAIGWMALAACAAAASAQISLGSAVDLALKNDSRIRMWEASVQKAQAGLNEARDVYIPTAGAQIGYGEGVGVPTALPTVISLTGQSLVFNFSQRDNIRAAAAGLRAARLSLADMRSQVEQDVAITYLNLNSDERKLAVMDQEASAASRLVIIAQERLDAGADTRMDLLKAQRTAAQIQLDKMSLQDDAASLSDHLSRLIGLPDDQLTTIQSSIPAVPVVEATHDEEDQADSPGIEAALANARSKQEIAFGENRYRLRPEMTFGINYTRIDTSQNAYTTYYPAFLNKSENALSVYLTMNLPIYDRHHQDEAADAMAEAHRAYFESETQREQFLESRRKLRRNAAELAARSKVAELDQEIAQEQVKVIEDQLTTSSSSNPQQMTPEDEQRALLDESGRTLDLLDSQYQLEQTRLDLLEQTGRLEEWIQRAAALSEGLPAGAVNH
ncbi:MAG: TolC family protein [Acidobacteriaceae bacterium]